MEKYYRILGLKEGASAKEIKSAYRKFANKFHPDKNQDEDAETKFKEVKEAYEILTGKKKVESEHQSGGGFGGFNPFEDMVASMFNQQRRPQEDLNINIRVDVTLEDIAFNNKKEVKYKRKRLCQKCSGTGAKKKTTCRSCNGTGHTVTNMNGFAVKRPCQLCSGKGFQIDEKCDASDCSAGIVYREEVVDITIPAEVQNDMTLRVSRRGHESLMGNVVGELYIVVRELKHVIFTRNMNDLTIIVPVSYKILCLGGDIQVCSLHERLSLKVPKETQSDTTFRMKGKGLNTNGNLYITLKVETPVNLSDEQIETLTKFDDSDTTPKHKSYLEKIINYFVDRG
jgi:molecular chaperone DnaJ